MVKGMRDCIAYFRAHGLLESTLAAAGAGVGMETMQP
jgi:hypothetical protein